MIGRDEPSSAARRAWHGQFSLFKAIVQIAGSASVLDAARLHSAGRQELTPARRAVPARADSSSLRRSNLPLATRPTPSRRACRAGCCAAAILQGSDDLKLTQEFLGADAGRSAHQRLGGRKHAAAGRLIRYSRGNIRILDLEAWAKTEACECYETVKIQAERLLGPTIE